METSSNRRIIKNTVFLYFRMFLTMGITLYTSRVVLSILGISDYGLYNVVGGIVVVLSFLNGALSSATSRFLTFELGLGNQQSLQNVFSASFCLHVVVSLVILLIGETIGLWFLYNKLIIPADRVEAAFWVYQISLLNAMITLTQTPYNASIISHEKMNIYAYVSIGESVCKLLMIYILSVFLIDKLILYAILLFFISLLVSLYYRYYCAKHFTECRIKLFWNKKLYVRLLSYSGWDLFGNIAVVCQGQGLNIILNMFCGTGVNAARAITYQVHAAVNSFVSNFLTASRPQIIKSYARKNIDEMYKLMFMTTRYSFFLLTLIILPILFELPTILNLWLSEVPEHTSNFTRIVLVACLIGVFGSASLPVYHAIGKIRLGNTLNGSLMICVLPVSYFLLKMNYPPEYVFITLLIINSCVTVIGLFIIRSYEFFSMFLYLKKVVLPALVVLTLSSIVPIIITMTFEESVVRFILLFACSEIWMLLLIYFIGINEQERKKIKAIIRKKLNINEKYNITQRN